MNGRRIIFALLLLFSSVLGKKIECWVDEAESHEDPNNVYRCSDGETCCKENGVPSCCKPKDLQVSMWEQIQLWGTLAGLIIILAILMWSCRHDGDWCCNRKDGGRYKYFCCGPIVYREGKGPNPELNDPFYDPEKFTDEGERGQRDDLPDDKEKIDEELKASLEEDDDHDGEERIPEAPTQKLHAPYPS